MRRTATAETVRNRELLINIMSKRKGPGKFKTIPFPRNPNIVYVIGTRKRGRFLPIYVGRSTRHIGRLGDYVSAQFNAPTDFKVGKAVDYLMSQGEKVVFRYRSTHGRLDKAERKLINFYKGNGSTLLNSLPGFNRKTTNSKIEVRRIRNFVRKYYQ